MSTFDCPLCGAEYETGNYPDHLAELDRQGNFQFECDDCGLEFDVHVDWDPMPFPYIEGSRLVRWTDPIL